MIFKTKNNRYGSEVSLNIFGRKLGIYLVKLPDNPTTGISSLCDGRPNYRFKHVIFLDYDYNQEWMVREELEFIARKHHLTNFYLFYTKRKEEDGGHIGNYCAISLTRKPFANTCKILQETHADYAYKRVPSWTTYKFWVLRMVAKKNSPAPVFLDLIPRQPINMKNEISRAHLNFLSRWFNLPKLPYENLDNSRELLLSTYLTSSISKG